jgi:8-oxo-dGTP pyrophosphatase MutT (NUDIX family)
MPTEQCYGVIVVYKGEENLFLILQQDSGWWSFPKGHHEENETSKETALRETEEETGIKEIEILDFPLIHEENIVIRNGKEYLKCNDYFIGFVKDRSVNLQQNEIVDHKWLTFNEALGIFSYPSREEVLKKAQEYLNMVK